MDIPADGFYRYYANPDAQGVIYEIHNGWLYGLMRSGHVRRYSARTLREFPGRFVRLVDEPDKPRPNWADAPDGIGWWAFEGHWTTAFPKKAVIFHHVWDVYLMTDGELYIQQGDNGYPITELTGKWWRIHLPWEQHPAAATATDGAEHCHQ